MARGRPQPFGGYPSRSDYAEARIAAGATAQQIAAELATSAGCVRGLLYARQQQALRQSLVLDLPEPDMRRLATAAADRALPPILLARDILVAVLRDNLVEAVIDAGD